MEAERHDVGGERQRHAHGDDERRIARLPENEAADKNGRRRCDDDPFALEPVAEEESEQRSERRRKRDHRCIAEAGRDRDPLLDQQRGHPIVEAVKSDGLKDVEDAHQDHPTANAWDPEVEEAARRRHRLLGAGRRQRPAILRLDLGLDAAQDAVRLLEPAALGEPARAFRQAEPQIDDDRRGQRPDQHHPAPALEPERRRRHQHIGEERDDRHADEADRLVDRKGASPNGLWRELAQIGADGHHLDAEADAGDEAPEIEAGGVALQRHHDVGRRVPEKRPGEDRPPAEPVGEKATKNCPNEEAGEQGGDEARHPRRAEEAGGRGGQQAGLDQTRRDIGRKQEVVELEEHAEAEQHDDRPDRAGWRQPVDAGRNRSGADPRRSAVVHVSSPRRRSRACLALSGAIKMRVRGDVSTSAKGGERGAYRFSDRTRSIAPTKRAAPSIASVAYEALTATSTPTA